MEDDDEALSASDPSNEDEDGDGDEEEDVELEGGGESDDNAPRAPPLLSNDDRKSKNVDALVRGNLVVKRQSLIPRVLSVTQGAAVCRKPFKPPCSNGYDDKNEQLGRRLYARKRFVPWGSSRPALVAITNQFNIQGVSNDVEEEKISLPPGIEPLVFLVPIEVDPLLVRSLRPHQREGVLFMFECVSSLCGAGSIHGCILADDMGLGKTLQSITLLYTLLHQGFDGKPMVKKAIIVTPTSLVSNWEAEIKKWVGERVQLIALCESTKDDVLLGIDRFTCPRSSLQNDLEEFFAMVNFTNPGILGDISHFRRYYETPIICGREPTATEEEKKLGSKRSTELSAKVNQFILRRTNALLSNHLPPKIIEVVCCKLTPLQAELYNHFIQSKNVKRAISEEVKQSKMLAYITALKKLCNHPKLIYDTVKSGTPTSGFEDCIRFFPSEMFSGRSGSWSGGDGAWVELSGKMHVLARLLAHLRHRTNDRIVLVSNYTQTLDLFAQLCRERRYPYLRLDGTTTISKRQKLVNRFNDPSKDEFAFLLSSKAGGCGLNLIGGNRLVLFDPDWNPANDKQAAARVWRDGQKKRVYIYRFLSAGTIEEKVYQRQISKEGLQKVIQRESSSDRLPTEGNYLSTEDLRDLFTFHENARSEIHEKMNCLRCQNTDDTENWDIGSFAEIAGCFHKLKSSEKQVGIPKEEDLGSWGHHFSATTVPDIIFQASAGEEVTFVFTNQVDGKLVPVEGKVSPDTSGANSTAHSLKRPLNEPDSERRCQQPYQTVASNRHYGKRLLSDTCKVPHGAEAKPAVDSSKERPNILQNKLHIANKLPLKRLPPGTLKHDDDFV
ncbi:hypothetical protein CRG98_024053 [Punica granatum]|uniref:Helicase C-terminal domain-containing protein n=1 Tax=Punica granatum TaxID=22663 RepID=A0A2I0JHQ4_PUNGR|nr:hypothetical protein CRG98_024053 [Punica granatum]